MEEAVSERHKAFDAAHRSDGDHQAYTSASRHASSVITKAEAWQVTFLFHPNLTLNWCTLSFILSLALLPPLLTSPTVPLPKSQLQFLLIA